MPENQNQQSGNKTAGVENSAAVRGGVGLEKTPADSETSKNNLFASSV
jgi:hypothetical protein